MDSVAQAQSVLNFVQDVDPKSVVKRVVPSAENPSGLKVRKLFRAADRVVPALGRFKRKVKDNAVSVGVVLDRIGQLLPSVNRRMRDRLLDAAFSKYGTEPGVSERIMEMRPRAVFAPRTLLGTFLSLVRES